MDYALAPIRYTGQDSLSCNNGRPVIGFGRKSDAVLLAELRIHEGAVIASLRESLKPCADSIATVQLAEGIKHGIRRESQFGVR